MGRPLSSSFKTRVRYLINYLEDRFDFDGEAIGQRGEAERAAGMELAIIKFPEQLRSGR